MRRSDELILAIDQGTSSTKALLFDESGNVVGHGNAPVAVSYPAPGWVEQSAETLWESVQRAVLACLSADSAGGGDFATRVAGIGISVQRESLVLWERDSGKPVGPLVSWEDQRTAADCAAFIGAGVDQLVKSVTGLPLDPMFSALKARWLLDQYDPDRARSLRGELCLGTVDSWLLSRFGPVHATEVGNASRTQLMDVRTQQWDDRLLELFGVPRRVLPEVLPSDGPFPPARGLAPAPDGVPVLAVMGDSHAALFAHGGWRPGVVKATYGTGSSVMALLSSPTDMVDGVCLTAAWSFADTALAVEGNIRAAGRTITWLADLFGSTTEELLNEAAETDPDGVYVVPAFNGLGAPWWDAEAVAVISGVTLGTRRAHLAEAALESIAFQVEDVVAAVEATTGPVDTVLADGGLTRNDHLMQLQADISGRRVIRSAEPNLSATGVADAAGLSAGMWSWAKLDNKRRPGDEFQAGAAATARRGRRQEDWRMAVDRSRDCRPFVSPD